MRRRSGAVAAAGLLAVAVGGGADSTSVPESTADEWTRLVDAPLALTEVGAVAFQGELWVLGGITADAQVTTAVQVFDPATGAWRAGPELPEPVHHAPLVATDDQLVVVGGYRSIAFDPVPDVWVLDEQGDGWHEGPALPEPRGAGAAAWDGERIVYGGGVGTGVADVIWALDDVRTGTWEEVAALSVAREHLAAASDGEGAVWFLGGRQGGLDTNLGSVDLLTADGLESLGDPLTPRGGVAAFYSPDHGACLAGGEQPDSTFEEVECIDAEGALTSLPPLSVPRHGLGAAVIDGIAFVALGGPDPMLATSGVLEILDLR